MVSVGLIVLLCMAAAFADVIGGAIIVFRRFTETQVVLMMALGAGFLIGATFLDRLPDAVSALPTTAPLYIVIGYLAMLILQQFGAGHSHIPGESTAAREADAMHFQGASAVLLNRRAEVITFVGMLIHTFMDGVIIAGAFAMNVGTGLLMFLAITMHKIPEGFSMATISLAAGESRRTAFFTAVGLAVSTMVGALLTMWAGKFDVPMVNVVMALATGTFIYISTTGILPSIKESGERRAVYVVVIGVALFFVSLKLVEMIGLK